MGYVALGRRYENYVSLLKKNALAVFYAGGGKVRAVTQILDVKKENPDASNFKDACQCWLDDPYEGELFTNFLDLFGEWPSAAERESVWLFKREMLQRSELLTPQGNITVQKGYWFSAHEQWKYLEMPYLMVDVNRRVFENGERARTWYSAHMINSPGLMASVNNVTYKNDNPNYLSAAGIKQIAFQEINTTNVITPYGCFPSLLLPGNNRSVGLAWYHNMLRSPRGQGPYGSSEAQLTNGEAISPVITWDSKITTVWALLGGIQDIVAKYMRLENTTFQPEPLLKRFTSVIDREWSRVFPNLQGEHIPFSYPQIAVPEKLSPFPSCEIQKRNKI